MIYRIYCDGKLLYDPNIIDDGYGVSDTSLVQELNKAGSFEFTMPSTNVMYNDINKMKSIITVYQEQEEIFRGRVLHTEKDFYNRKQVYCEGELAYLVDSIQKPYDYKGSISTFLKNAITEHNSQMETEGTKRFTVGKVTVTDPNDTIVRSDQEYQTTWAVINDKLINMLGGYVRIRHDSAINYIDYLSDLEQTSTQVIEFGINMLDFSEYVDGSEVFTSLIPIGSEGLTISSVNNGSIKLTNSEAVKLYGNIVKTNKWDDVTEAKNLLTKAKAYLKEGIKLATTIEVQAVDLHEIDVDTDKIQLGDKVRVVSVAHNVDDYFLCSKIQYDIQSPDKTKFTLGVAKKGITDK